MQPWELKASTLHPEYLKRLLSLILAGGQGTRLYPLTRDRSKLAVPFGGTFRMIDFTLANCVNSGLRRIYVLTQYKSASLMRHVKHGWNIFSAELGEYIYTVPPQLRVSENWYLGTADAVYQNIYTLAGEKPEHVLVLSGDHVYRMDYREMLAQHIHSEADATLAVVALPASEAHRFGVVEVATDDRVVGFHEKPADLSGDVPAVLVSMGVFLFRTEVLVNATSQDARIPDSHHDFGHDVLPALVKSGAKVVAHRFRGAGSSPEPYWRDVGTIDSFYEANMDLVQVTPRFNLYDRAWPMRSAPLQAPPAKFVFAGGESGRVGHALDSLVAPGAIISGGEVQRSIIGPFCRVNSWARVEESILMDGVAVGRNAMVRRAIIDKGAVIPAGARIGYDRAEDEARFTVSPGGIVVIPRGETV